MTFLTPGLAILAAGIGVPAIILLHVLRLRRLPQRVPSTLLWRRSVQDLEANVPFQRLRPSWLFALQLLALLCAALAAGQPVLRGDSAPHTLVIVLDARARMNATVEAPPPATDSTKGADDGADPVPGKASPAATDAGGAPRGASESAAPATPRRTRFDDARDRARELVRSRAGSMTQVHLVTARAKPGLVASGSARAVIDAIDRLAPTDEPGDPDHAMALAAELAPDGDIHWIGDRPEDEVANVGITVLAAQRSTREPGTVDVLVSAVNSGTAPVESPLIVSIDGATMAARVVKLPPASADPAKEPGRATLLVRVPEKPGALLEARLVSHDVLAIDDRASLRFSPAAPLRVAFMGDGASPMAALLGVMDAARVESIPCDATADALARFDLVVADGCMPRALRAPDAGPSLPPSLVFAWPDSSSGTAPRPPAASDATRRVRATIAGAARAHAVTQGVPPLSVEFAAPADERFLDAPPPGATPLLVERESIIASIDPRAPSVRFHFPLAATEWPADPSWVMTMQNAVQWLVGDEAESAGAPIRTGHSARILAQRRDGSRAVAPVPPQSRVGSIDLAPPDADPVRHPISLLDEAQSDLRALPAPEDPRARESRAAAAGAARRNAQEAPARDGDRPASTDGGGDAAAFEGALRPLWPWCAIAALAFLCVEWCVYLAAINRRAA